MNIHMNVFVCMYAYLHAYILLLFATVVEGYPESSILNSYNKV